VTEVVLPRLRLHWEALSEGDQVLAPDLEAFDLGYVVLVLDRSEDPLLGAPDLGRFPDVAVDHVPQRRVFKRERERAWFPQLLLPAVQPRFGSLLAIECLGLPIDNLPALLPDDLCAICLRAVLPLPWNYGPHGTPFAPEVRLWRIIPGKWPETRENETTLNPRKTSMDHAQPRWIMHNPVK
jgi:hypothetical protein